MEILGLEITVHWIGSREHRAKKARLMFTLDKSKELAAIKEVRDIFRGTKDERATLRGAIMFVNPARLGFKHHQ